MSVQTYNHQIFTTDNLAHSYSFIEEQEKVVKLDNKFLDTIIAIDMTEENCTVSTSGDGKTTYFSLRLSEDVANLFKDEKRNMVILNNYYCLHRSAKYSTGTKFFGIFYDTQWKGQITCYHLRIDGTLAELITEVLPISMLDNDANFINEESVDAKINAINTTKDWNENDASAAAYIENRTHYVEGITKSDTPIYSNTNIEDSSWELSDNNNNVYVLTGRVSISNNEIGPMLCVSINGVEQYLEIQQSGSYYYVGNPALSSKIPSDIDTGEDYLIILKEAK